METLGLGVFREFLCVVRSSGAVSLNYYCGVIGPRGWDRCGRANGLRDHVGVGGPSGVSPYASLCGGMLASISRSLP